MKVDLTVLAIPAYAAAIAAEIAWQRAHPVEPGTRAGDYQTADTLASLAMGAGSRVHHGSNRRYLDRNHGSILIVWDKLFGTFEPETEPVVYGLTRNIDTYNPARIATHELVDIARDVAGADSWHDRISYLVRGPGWAYARAGVA